MAIGRRRPLSPGQERLWFLTRLQAGARPYEVPVAFRFDGPLDVAALGTALARVVERHDVLAGQIHDGPHELTLEVTGWPERLPVMDWQPPGGVDWRPGRVLAVGELPELVLPPGRMMAVRLLRADERLHVLHLVIHHLAFDGASFPVLCDELCRAYRATIDDPAGAAPLPPLPACYPDYVRWQRERRGSPAVRDRLARTVRALAGAAELDLATDAPRPSPMSYRGASHSFTIGADRAAQVRRFAADQAATPFMVLAAVYAVTLSRRAAPARDFLIGTPLAGRDRPEWEPLIGLFAEMAALRARLSPTTSFRELVRSIRDEVVRAADGGTVPFDRIVAELRPGTQELSRPPLCPATIQVLYQTPATAEAAGVSIQPLPVARRTCEVELALHVVASADLPAVVEYAADLFTPGTVARIAEEFLTLCDGLLGDPDRPVTAVDHHGPRRQALVAAGDAGPRGTGPGPGVPDVFRVRVAAAGAAPAVRCHDTTLSFPALDADSDRLAHRLREAGVRRGDVVAVAVDRDQRLPGTLLGVLKAGAAYLPLDPDLPPARVATILQAARPVLAVTGGAAGRAATGMELPTLPVTGPAPAVGGKLPVVTGADLAYVLFTSGTTGEPKGVAVTHQGVVSLAARPTHVRAGSCDVVAQLAPLSFDASTFEIWTALLNGAAVAVSPTTRPTPSALHGFVKQHRVTIMSLTSGLLRVVADERPELLGGLRYLVTGGDVVPPAQVARILERHPGLRVRAVYGPTEVTAFASVAALDRPDPTRPVPLGLPIPGRETYVVNGEHLASPGVPGEILVGGAGLAVGYLNRPALTAERFVPHPIRPGARLYRTGDIGQWGAGGMLEFVGRADRQVKVRGFRVEPAEVEAVLAGHPAVRLCSVQAHRRDRDATLVAHVVAASQVTGEDLLTYLRDRLPAYCLPSRVRLHDRLPLTGQGKVDAAALAAGADDPLADARARAPARPPEGHEELVLSVWRAVLGDPTVDLDSDFFASGGSSLSALQVAAQLERRTGRQVPVRVLFTEPTVPGLARWLAQADAADAPADALAGAADAAEAPAGAVGAPAGARDPDGASSPEDDAALVQAVTGASADEVAALVDRLTSASDR